MHTLIPYTFSGLTRLLSSYETPASAIKGKPQLSYFHEYLNGIDARFILIEEEYMSADYIKDFTTYYADCFKSYKTRCKRLHFFAKNPAKLFQELIRKGATTKIADVIQSMYLGFIVVKPLPNTVFGTTILKPWHQQDSGNNFWATKKYKIHLMGLELEIDSLAFQEQDANISNCATMALWSVLQKASENYYINLRSPGELTRDLGLVSHSGNRVFPYKDGLPDDNIGLLLAKSGLQPEIKDLTEKDNCSNILRKLVHAYANQGLPLILHIYLPDKATEDNQRPLSDHAVAIVGYNNIKPRNFSKRNEKISWISDNLEVLYAHDDQIGPFAYMKIVGEKHLQTRWTNWQEQNMHAEIASVILPVFPEVRVSFKDIYPLVLGMDALLDKTFGVDFNYDLHWDLQLVYSEDMKRRVAGHSGLTAKYRANLLSASLPKYIWTCKCYFGSLLVFEVIFDATSLYESMLGLRVIFYADFFRQYFKKIFRTNNKAYRYFLIPESEDIGKAFFNFFKDQVLNPQPMRDNLRTKSKRKTANVL